MRLDYANYTEPRFKPFGLNFLQGLYTLLSYLSSHFICAFFKTEIPGRRPRHTCMKGRAFWRPGAAAVSCFGSSVSPKHMGAPPRWTPEGCLEASLGT